MDLKKTLEEVALSSRETFERKRGVLSFGEYMELLVSRPYSLTRYASQFLKDVFDHHGSYDVSGMAGQPIRRWRLFDDPSREGLEAVFGHEHVQNRLYEILSEFVERGRADKFILLHGPNGSAKSSIVSALVSALEGYSRTDEGPLYRMSWIFCEAGEQGQLGFQPDKVSLGRKESFAHVDEKLISSRIPCELKDPPFLLLPKKKRREILDAALAEASPAERERFRWTDFVLRGDLSPKNKTIYESLLKAYEGDWTRVVRHIRVERYYISQRYRTGAVTIEPQGTIDASSRMLAHASMSGLPPVLAHENLHEAAGDLIDAIGGIVEYSDFLKRSMEAHKYLLTTAERGFVNLPAITVPLNLILLGSTNEKYLAAFKRDPSFASFKGRFELVRVAYLREYRKEALIYRRHLDRVAGLRSVAPHTATIAALWTVLTRLKRPNAKHIRGKAGELAARLSPMEKASLYDDGSLPPRFNDEERKEFRGRLDEIVNEFEGLEEEFEGFVDAAYEGRRGASARETMTLLTELAVASNDRCLSPAAVFTALPRMISDRSLYSYLRLPADGGYHDPEEFIIEARRVYVRILADEVRRASSLIEETEYGRLFREYLQNVRASETHDKVVDPKTLVSKAPDERLMADVEGHLGVTGNARQFRQSLITKAAAWKLSNPTKELDVDELFRDSLRALERGFFNAQLDRVIQLVKDALAVRSGAAKTLSPERSAGAEQIIHRLKAECGYDDNNLNEMLGFFLKHQDDLEP